MSTSEEAAKCIQHLHRTEMHGRNITVDRVSVEQSLGSYEVKTWPDTQPTNEATWNH